MRKSIIALAGAMFGLASQAEQASKSMNQVKNNFEQDSIPFEGRPSTPTFYGPSYSPIYWPTKSQKIKNKVNRLRRGIKK